MTEQSRTPIVLLVEDSRTQREAFCLLFEDAGFRVLQAASGEEAVERLQGEARPDVAVLDVGLPDTDGRALCASIRNMPTFSAMPVLMLTAMEDIDAKVDALDRGADDFVPKTAEAGELVARVRRLVERGQSQILLTEEKQLETLRQAALTMAHGINNPLQVLALCMEMLEHDPAGGSQFGQLVNRMKSQMDRIHELVWGLQRASRVAQDPQMRDANILEMPRNSLQGRARRAPGSPYRATIVSADASLRSRVRSSLESSSRFLVWEIESLSGLTENPDFARSDLMLCDLASVPASEALRVTRDGRRVPMIGLVTDEPAEKVAGALEISGQDMLLTRFDGGLLPELAFRALERFGVSGP